MLVRESDLNTPARIRNAALESFATNGVAGTTIRDVAKTAGVSPGLVQHHFSSKAGLRQAVNDYVMTVVAEAGFDQVQPSADTFRELGERLGAITRENPMVFLYVARSLAEDDAAARDLFDGFVALSAMQLERLADRGLLPPDLDTEWGAMFVPIFAFGSLVFQNAVNRHLDAPFTSPEGLDRWTEFVVAVSEAVVFRDEAKRPSA